MARNLNLKGTPFRQSVSPFFFPPYTRLFEIKIITEARIEKEILASRLSEALLAESFKTRPCSIAKHGEPHIA
jgi:hypothetical protein